MNHPYEMPDRAETLPPLPGDASAAGDSGLEALLPGSPPVLAYGTVLDEKTSSCDVILDDGSRIRARRADGCLLAPQPRDRVLVARRPTGNPMSWPSCSNTTMPDASSCPRQHPSGRRSV
jgi:hypothetical protein